MSRRFQISLRGLLALTFIASLAAALAHYDARAKIADAEAMVKFRAKVVERLIAIEKSGEHCYFPGGLIREKQAELRKAQQQLEQLKEGAARRLARLIAPAEPQE